MRNRQPATQTGSARAMDLRTPLSRKSASQSRCESAVLGVWAVAVQDPALGVDGVLS